ncbi:MAG: HD domain-containing protein, partial [Quisquiliibacterium sp.]
MAAEPDRDSVAGSGETISAHARGTVQILREVYADHPSQCAAALFGSHGKIGLDEVKREFGDETATLVAAMRKVHKLRSLHFRVSEKADGEQTET